jgi:RNA recognition motif-containing protein
MSATTTTTSMRLHIAGIPYDVDVHDLRELVEPFGRVTDVHIPRERDGRSRGYGFATFALDADGVRAMAALDGAEWCGRTLRVAQAMPRQGREGTHR